LHFARIKNFAIEKLRRAKSAVEYFSLKMTHGCGLRLLKVEGEKMFFETRIAARAGKRPEKGQIKGHTMQFFGVL